MADRRFGDSEVGEILKRAAEMQSGLAPSGTAEGVTLEELQSVAAEVGIKPEHIERAARELGNVPNARSQPDSGSILLEQTVEGELADETWDEIVTAMRRFTGSAGQVETRGQSSEWMGRSDVGATMLSATSRNGQTRLKLLGDTSSATAMTATIGFGIGVFSSLVPLIVSAKHNFSVSTYVTLALTILIASLCIAATRSAIQVHRRKLGQRIESLLSELTGIAEAARAAERPVARILADPRLVQEDAGPVRSAGR